MVDDRRFTVPLFTIDEAAHHLGLPRTTLKDWTRRQAGPAPLVHRIVNPSAPRAASLPFVAVIEAHMLRGFRELGLSAQGLRDSVAHLRTNLDDEYALATRRLASDGVDLLVDMSQHGEPAEWARAIDSQGAIREVIEDYLKFVRWGKDRYPERLTLKAYQGADVIIDPRFAFGQPVLERQKVRVEDILDAFWAGEGYVRIAKEFGVRADEVEAVVRSATRPRAAA
ncbi:MAG TPA: DUF433 domain-containing protein [Streptosporangiaceae bacterium]|nr:DUF433 domain-containing protein [Streptosporangiaceae bacterium]